MIIPIIYPSALQFWQDSNLLNYSEGFSLKNRTLAKLPSHYDFHPTTKISSYLSSQYGFTYPIQLLAPDKISRRYTKGFSCSKRPMYLPPESFIEVASFYTDSDHSELCHIYIATPELCFLEAAVHLSLFELIQLGYDLCSQYLTDATAEYQHVNRKLIASRQSISDYLAQLSNINGIKKARLAIRQVVDNSNSPMETKLTILLTLPMHLGGYGIYRPELNKKVILSPQSTQLLQRDYCICDLVWEDKKIIIEYDSNLTHLNAVQHGLDKARQTALTLSGYQVISLTASNLRYLSEMDKTFTMLREKLGLRKESARLNKYINERHSLQEFLFHS